MKIYIFIFVVLIFGASGTLVAQQEKPIDVLINEQRRIYDLADLKESALLRKAAHNHARDMVAQNYFSHISKNGDGHVKRISKTGFKACYTAENIAKGQKEASEVIKNWMASKGHRDNITNAKAEQFGFASEENIWVLILARQC